MYLYAPLHIYAGSIYNLFSNLERGKTNCLNLSLTGEGKLTFGDNFYEGNFIDDKMLGPGRYVFKDGSQQIGEYVYETPDATKGDELTDTGERQRSGNEIVTKWRCKKKIPGTRQKITFTEDV